MQQWTQQVMWVRKDEAGKIIHVREDKPCGAVAPVAYDPNEAVSFIARNLLATGLAPDIELIRSILDLEVEYMDAHGILS